MVPRTIFCSAVFQKHPLGLFADSGLARKCSKNGSSTIWVCSPALGGRGAGAPGRRAVSRRPRPGAPDRRGVKLTRLRRNGSIVERISANCLTSCLMFRASMPIRATRYIYRTLLRIHKDNFCLECVSMHQPSSRETCLFLQHGRRLSLITLQCYQRRDVSCYIRQFHPIKMKIST